MLRMVIVNRDSALITGMLSYEELNKSFMINIGDCKKSDLYLNLYKDKGLRTLSGREAMTWVRLRLPPPERQTLSYTLKLHGLNEYDEWKMLHLWNGSCDKDNQRVFDCTEEDYTNFLNGTYIEYLDKQALE